MHRGISLGSSRLGASSFNTFGASPRLTSRRGLQLNLINCLRNLRNLIVARAVLGNLLARRGTGEAERWSNIRGRQLVKLLLGSGGTLEVGGRGSDTL